MILKYNTTTNQTTEILVPDLPEVGVIGINKEGTIYASSFYGTSNPHSQDDTYLLNSTDGGQTWNNLTHASVYNADGSLYGELKQVIAWKTIEDIIFNPNDPDEMWISVGGVKESDVFRVLHSQDGGLTWYDFSKNLSSFPVETIEFMEGQDILFAGTDAGIYYTEVGNNDWKCFSHGMPIAQVTDLDYNPCNGYLYVSTYGRAVYKTFVDLNNVESEHTLPSGSNITWNYPVEMNSNLIIPSGTTLTVTEMLNMGKNSKIVVEQGAQLIIDGGVVTNQCGEQWQGIEVWGYRDESQMECVNTGMTCHQGYLELKNGAVIENAKVAVDLWNPNHYGQTGGIVIAEDATFRNNAKSVHAMYYQNFNPVNPTTEMQTVSHFYNCTFEITDEYEGATFYKHADLAEVNGILFKGCDFSVDPDAHDVSPYCSAIAAYDAGFKVEERCLNSNTIPCSNMDKSTFTGFYTAIDARSTGIKSYTFNVHNSEFFNNTNGVVCSNIDNAAILFNEFYIGQNNADQQCCSSATGTGVYMNYSTGFAIEENDFLLATGAPSGDYIGIRIEETEGVDEIYKNTFDGLTYANFAEGVNYGVNIYHGLAYYCNDNTNNYADFFVADSYIDGIQSEQGNDYLVTGNTFSPSSATWHFYNGGGHLIGYYYCNSCSNENPDDSKTYGITEHPKSLTNDCDSHYGGSATRSVSLTEQEVEEAEQKYYEAYSNYSNVELLYNAYKDGGSTPNEIEAVETAQPSDMWELRAMLLGDSPHLSLEVLKETADRTDVFSDQALFDILSANPDELKKDELIKYLEEKDEPLPDYMIEILKQVAEGSTYKTVIINQLSEYAFKKAEAANDIIRSLLNEETPDMSALRNWLDNLGGAAADRQIISTYMHEDNYADALTLANMLPALYNLTGDELNDHYDYVEMIGLFKELYEEDRTIHQLTESESDQLKIIIENNYGTAAATAKNIMYAINDEHFYNCPNLNEDLTNKAQSINMDDWAKTNGTSVTVSPNPAREWVSFDYTLSGNESTGVIILANSQGKIVREIEVTGQQGQKLVDTRNLPSGTYFFTLKSEGVVQTGKLLIAK